MLRDYGVNKAEMKMQVAMILLDASGSKNEANCDQDQANIN